LAAEELYSYSLWEGRSKEEAIGEHASNNDTACQNPRSEYERRCRYAGTGTEIPINGRSIYIGIHVKSIVQVILPFSQNLIKIVESSFAFVDLIIHLIAKSFLLFFPLCHIHACL